MSSSCAVSRRPKSILMTYRQRQQGYILIPRVDQVDDLECRFSGTVDVRMRLLMEGFGSGVDPGDSRIALLGIDHVRNFEVQSEVGLVVLQVAGISLINQ